MRSSFRDAKTTPSASPQRRGGPAEKKFPRRGGGAAGGAVNANTVELTRVQQLEAKAARDAVLATAPKASPAAAKKFVESISLDVDIEAARQLLLPRKALPALPNSIGVLCQQLRKLDVSGNDLTDLSPLASLQHLSNLNVAHNPRLASLKGLSGTCLSVLNVSFCSVESLVGLEHTALTLRTLIANDNRLQFQSPIFRSGSGSSSSSGAGDLSDSDTANLQADVAAAAEQLPTSLRASVPVNATAIRNFTIFATFQQCETVVLSRNAQLAQCFPAWSAEELSAACGDKPRQAAQGSGEDSAEDSGAEEEEQERPRSGGRRDARDERKEAEEVSANKALKHAMALAHPLSVFERLPRLKKLSLSGCELHSLPPRWFLPMVTELRLAQNHLTSLQPDGVILRSLHILDVSNNLFMSVVTLRRCRYLEQLNVRGNPLMDEGAVQDRTAGLVAEASSDATVAAAAVVPVSVQQRVVRLFPAVKLLDNQPVLTSEEMRAAYKRGRAATAAAEAAAAQSAEKEEETKREMDVQPGEDDDAVQVDALEGSAGRGVRKEQGKGAPAARNTASSTAARAPARKAPRVDAAAIAAEAEEMDVVIEAPPSVLKTPHASIVRRERVLLRPNATSQAKGGDAKRRGGSSGATATPAPTLFGQAAVNKLLEQNRKTSAW